MRKEKIREQSNLDFRLMSMTYKIRDLRLSRINILKEVVTQKGSTVLDYGCGPGSYVMPLAELVGESGKIYSLDVHPLAIQAVRKIAIKRHLKNVQTILSNCQTGLPPSNVDVVLLYDILHNLVDVKSVLEELHRVLKPSGILSVSDHHLKQDEIISKITNDGLFKLLFKGRRTYSFSKEEM